MKFENLIIYVPDVEKALKFYEKSFGLSTKFITECKSYGELATGQTNISFSSLKTAERLGLTHYPNQTNQLPAGLEITLITDDVQAAYTRAIEAGAQSVQPPKTYDWGQTAAHVRDLNGVLVELATPLG